MMSAEPQRLCAVFLFAHPDDEFGVFSEIEAAVAKNERVICLYLTDGAYGGQSADRRKAETLTVLSALGVAPDDVCFVGVAECIPDGQLHNCLGKALRAAESILERAGSIRALYVLAWEGGHQDHDAAHLVGLALAQKFGLLGRTLQFPLYRSAGILGAFFVLSPLPSNGQLQSKNLPWPKRFKYLRLCFSYASQARAWLVLFPFILLHMIFVGKQMLQPVEVRRIKQPPHPGRPLYERRGFLSYGEFSRASTDFVVSSLEV